MTFLTEQRQGNVKRRLLRRKKYNKNIINNYVDKADQLGKHKSVLLTIDERIHLRMFTTIYISNSNSCCLQTFIIF